MQNSRLAPLTWAKILVVTLAGLTAVGAATVAIGAVDPEVNCFKLMAFDPAAYKAKCQVAAPPPSLVESDDREEQVELTLTVTQ